MSILAVLLAHVASLIKKFEAMNLSAGYKSSLSCDAVSAMEAMADFDQEIFAEAEAMAELFGSDHDLDVDSCFLLSEDSFCDLLHWPEDNSAAAAPPFAESEETFNEASKRKAGASSAPVPKKKIKKRTAMNVQSSNCYSSKDDSNGSGRRRAGRGKANDPQSLYARKRRERINERLRILQNLVPNGTKVDISTMLEEAVQYVKFLQLQIKLLSSDELWMYAPIAYQGMSLGLDQKISGL